MVVHSSSGHELGVKPRALPSGGVELRRAILLFAIVLGLAAVATSVSRPPASQDDARRRPAKRTPAASSTPTAKPRRAAARERRLAFRAGGRPLTRYLPSDRAATVIVSVPEPGQVELAGLGLGGPAEPLTPARFEVFVTEQDRHRVRFTPLDGGERRTVGVLQVLP